MLCNAKSGVQKEYGMKEAGKTFHSPVSGDQICRDQIPEERLVGAKP